MNAISVGVVMGSSSDWDTMQHAVQILKDFGIAHEARVVSAHRMPDDMFAYAEAAVGRGLKAIIAGAGGAAHLPGMIASKTVVPVLGVPVQTKALSGVDSLHSIVQMPKGVPVATFAIGAAGAANAALFAVAMLANEDPALREKLQAFRAQQTEAARLLPIIANALVDRKKTRATEAAEKKVTRQKDMADARAKKAAQRKAAKAESEAAAE